MTSILLIEDNIDIRETLADILQFEGYDVLAAADGREALRILENAYPLPRLILLDLLMPVMSGHEFRERLRERSEWQSIPVVLCSGSLDVAFTRGMEPLAGSLRKPVDVPELLELLAACCSREPVSSPAPSATVEALSRSVTSDGPGLR